MDSEDDARPRVGFHPLPEGLWWDTVSGMEKVSLSLDPDLLGEARQVSGARGLSGFVNDALRVRLQHERVRRLLAEMDDEFGPVPDGVMEEVRRSWPQLDAQRDARRSA